MSFTFSNSEEVDYAKLGMCPVCAVRFTHGCEHSNTIEAQEWLAAYAIAEHTGGTEFDQNTFSDAVEFAMMNDEHAVDMAQRVEREIDATLKEQAPLTVRTSRGLLVLDPRKSDERLEFERNYRAKIAEARERAKAHYGGTAHRG